MRHPVPMRLLSATLLAALSAALPLPAQSDPGAARPALRVIEVGGTPWERGFTHGQQLRTEIAARFSLWAKEVEREHHLPLDAFVDRFLAGTHYDAAARKWTPELLDEVRGIAAGAEQPYARVFCWQLIDEVWAMAGAVLRDKCTVVGVDRNGDQPTLAAGNIDLGDDDRGFQTVLHVRDEARHLQAFVVTLPGCVGAAGLSSAPVAVTCNTLLQLRPCRDGLPVAFVVRGLLLQPDQAHALAFLQQVRHASGQHYIVAGPATAPGFECSAGKVVRWQPFADAPFTFHTNNPLANDDFAAAYRERAAQAGFDPLVGKKPCPRLELCRQSLPAGRTPDLAAVKALLASRQGTPSINNARTYACYLMSLGARPEMLVSGGRPDEAAFTVLRFDP